MLNTHRDPANPDVVARAAAMWRTGPRNEAADALLLAMLADEGVLTVDEAVEAVVDPDTTRDLHILVEIHDGTTLVFVSPEGDITTMRG